MSCHSWGVQTGKFAKLCDNKRARASARMLCAPDLDLSCPECLEDSETGGLCPECYWTLDALACYGSEYAKLILRDHGYYEGPDYTDHVKSNLV